MKQIEVLPQIIYEFEADQTLLNGIIPSLINWESEKPINKMQDNHLNLEKIEVLLTENQLSYKNFMDSFGTIEKISFSIIKQKNISSIRDYPKLKLNIEDKIRDTIITL